MLIFALIFLYFLLTKQYFPASDDEPETDIKELVKQGILDEDTAQYYKELLKKEKKTKNFGQGARRKDSNKANQELFVRILASNQDNEDNTVFPASDSDLVCLIPIIMKSSACQACCTCKKDQMCTLNSYKALKKIASKYPDWSPPTEIPNNPSLNNLLVELLKNITDNMNLNCPSVLMWLLDPNIGHLLDPVLFLKMKLPQIGKGKKGSKSDSGINPAMMLALSGKKINPMLLTLLQDGEIDPAMMMMAMSQDGEIDPAMMMAMSQDGNIDPAMMMALSQDGNIDPMLLMAMQNKGKGGSENGLSLPLLFSMMNKNGKQKSGKSCSSSSNECPVTKACQELAKKQNSGTDGEFLNPAMMLLLSNGSIDPKKILLMMSMKNLSGNNAEGSGDGACGFKERNVQPPSRMNTKTTECVYGRNAQPQASRMSAENSDYGYGRSVQPSSRMNAETSGSGYGRNAQPQASRMNAENSDGYGIKLQKRVSDSSYGNQPEINRSSGSYGKEVPVMKKRGGLEEESTSCYGISRRQQPTARQNPSYCNTDEQVDEYQGVDVPESSGYVYGTRYGRG